MKKIAIVGPESTGKSTLAQQLADHYQTLWVPEYAREYVDSLDRPYVREDLLKIAKGQLASEEELAQKVNMYLICDTDLHVIKVWSDHSFGSTDPWILEQLRKRHYDLFLLTYIDIPWQDDPQREHPHLREYFYNVYCQLLKDHNRPFVEVKGTYPERLEKAIEAIDLLGTASSE